MSDTKTVEQSAIENLVNDLQIQDATIEPQNKTGDTFADERQANPEETTTGPDCPDETTTGPDCQGHANPKPADSGDKSGCSPTIKAEEVPAAFRAIVNLSEKYTEDGIHVYYPEDPKDEFPVLLDYTISEGSPCPIPEFAPDFKYTRKVVKKDDPYACLYDIPEDFGEDEFDLRIYLIAYTCKIVMLYGDGQLRPTFHEVVVFANNLVAYMENNCKKDRDEILKIGKEPNTRFHEMYPNNFINKYLETVPDRVNHPLNYQIITFTAVKPDDTPITLTYLYFAYILTPQAIEVSKAYILLKHKLKQAGIASGEEAGGSVVPPAPGEEASGSVVPPAPGEKKELSGIDESVSVELDRQLEAEGITNGMFKYYKYLGKFLKPNPSKPVPLLVFRF